VVLTPPRPLPCPVPPLAVTISGPISYVTFDPLQDVSATGSAAARRGRARAAAVPPCTPVLPPSPAPCPTPYHPPPPVAPTTTPLPQTRRHQPAEFLLSSTVGSLVVVAVACIRIYLGWSYVGKRLFSVAVAYEETGWCGPHGGEGRRPPAARGGGGAPPASRAADCRPPGGSRRHASRICQAWR
jgi:hypothetical protein